MDVEDKSARWKQRINDWKGSELSQKKYCQQYGLPLSSFSYWHRKLRKSSSVSGKLIPVSLSRPAVINLYLPSGLRIESPLHCLEEILPLLSKEANR